MDVRTYEDGQAEIRKVIRDSLRESQTNIVQIVCVGMILSGIIFVLSASAFPDPLQGTLPGLFLIATGGGASYALKFRFYIAETLVIVSLAGLLFGLAFALGEPWFLSLLGLLIGLTLILSNSWLGAGMAVVISFICYFLGIRFDLFSNIKGFLIFQLWGSFGITLLGVISLRRKSKESTEFYLQARDLLVQMRESHLILQATLKDLEDTNVQLTRLNILTQELYKQAEEARQAKQQFVANVSHELRTPMNMIINYGEMILKNPYKRKLPAPLMADLDVIVRNSQHLSGLVDDVLDMSQLEAGQMDLMREELELGETVYSAIEVVKPLFEKKAIRLDVIPFGESRAFFDRTRIREVLINLLSNAGRFTNEGFVRVRVDQDGTKYVVSIQDSGPGISKKEQNKLFQPFQQLDTSLKRRYGGTGLGLAISKRLIELHGGRIWLESEEGMGTTFYFTLPISAPEPTKAGPARWLYHDFMYKERTDPSLAPKPVVLPRYFVVDPSEVMQRITRRYFEDAEVTQMTDASEMKISLREGPGKALIVKKGNWAEAFATCDEIKLWIDETPLVISVIQELPSDASMKNIVQYLVKPITLESLFVAIEKLTDRVRTILIVDDDRDELQMFKRMISSTPEQYRVMTAYNGRQALSLIETDPPDLIILDLIMPEMSGYEFLTYRNLDDNLLKIPVLVISAQDPINQPLAAESLILYKKSGIPIQKMLDIIDVLSPRENHVG